MLLTLLSPNSPQADAIAKISLLVLVICAFIFFLVATLVFVATLRFREKSNPTPRKTFGNLRYETLWTIAPFLVLVVVFFFTVRTMYAVDPPEGDREADLIITGHQWWWEVKYPGSGVLTANEIHIETGKRYLVRLESADVIHSFWVPALARKIDAIPGKTNYLYLESDTPGIFHGVCAEFCGTQHAGMRIRVISHPKGEFAKWTQTQLVTPKDPTEGPAAEGAKIFSQKTCYNCHTIAGTGATMEIGPDLTHVASRQTLGAGVLKNSPENLYLWLENPQKFKPGSHMPNFQLHPKEIKALVAYLEGLQ